MMTSHQASSSTGPNQTDMLQLWTAAVLLHATLSCAADPKTVEVLICEQSGQKPQRCASSLSLQLPHFWV